MKIRALKIGATVGVALSVKGQIVELDDHRGQLLIDAGIAELAPADAVADLVVGGKAPPRSLRREVKPAQQPAAGSGGAGGGAGGGQKKD